MIVVLFWDMRLEFGYWRGHVAVHWFVVEWLQSGLCLVVPMEVRRCGHDEEILYLSQHGTEASYMAIRGAKGKTAVLCLGCHGSVPIDGGNYCNA